MTEHVGDLRIAAITEQPRCGVGFQLFEDVGFQLRIAVTLLEYLLAFDPVGLLDQVRDLGGLQLAHPKESPSKPRAGSMADQGFEILPVPRRMARAPGHQSEQARGAASVQTPDLQALRSGPHFHVVSPPQLGSGNIYQAVPQDVGAQKQLAVATFKAAKVKAINTQHRTLLVQLGELSRGDEQPSGPHARDQADYQRIPSGP